MLRWNVDKGFPLFLLGSVVFHAGLFLWLRRGVDSEPQVIPPQPGHSSVALVASINSELPARESKVNPPEREISPTQSTPQPAPPVPIPARVEVKPDSPKELLDPKLLEALKRFPWAELTRTSSAAANVKPEKPAPPKPANPAVATSGSGVATAPPAKSPPSPSSQASEGAETDELPRVVSNPAPRYPPDLEAAGITGRVLLRVRVGVDGRAASVRVERSSGTTALDEAALDAVRRWQFIPARRAGKLVARDIGVPVRFTIADR